MSIVNRQSSIVNRQSSIVNRQSSIVNRQPLVSIIIPCYNTEKYLSETLESVLNQTLQDFEVITINDGSTDNTLSILKQYSLKDPRISIIDQENTYYIQARVNGIQQASGKYLVCLDSDDKLAPTYLEKCVSVAEKNSNLNIVYSKAMLFGVQNHSWNLKRFQIKSFLIQNCIYCSALIRRSAYDKTTGFDTTLKMIEDWDLFISIIKVFGDDCVHRIEEPLFFYRKREDETSITNTATQDKLSDAQLRIYIKHYDFYKQQGLFLQNIFNAKRIIDEKYNKPWVKLFYRFFNRRKYKKYYVN